MRTLILLLAAMVATPASAEVSSAMRSEFPDAVYVAPYSASERAAAAQDLLHMFAPPHLGQIASLTPNAPYGADGSALNFWKPSFVIGTADGGEAGVNFWGLHNDGHINLLFTPASTEVRVLDCRLLSAEPITYKIITNGGIQPDAEGEIILRDHHLLLPVTAASAGHPVLVELWPQGTTTMGFFGCDISVVSE